MRVRTEVLGEVSRGRTSGRGATERNWQDLWLVSVTGQLKSLPVQEVRLECSKVRKPREATLFLGGNPPAPSHTLFLVLPSTTRQRWMEPTGPVPWDASTLSVSPQKHSYKELPGLPVSWHRRPSHDLHQSTRLQNRTPSEAGLNVQSLHPVQSSLGTS